MVKRIVCLYNQLAAKYENWKQNNSEDCFHVGLDYCLKVSKTQQERWINHTLKKSYYKHAYEYKVYWNVECHCHPLCQITSRQTSFVDILTE